MTEKNKIIVFSVVIVLLFVGLILYAVPRKNKNKETSTELNQISDISAFQVPETFYDFGTISMKNGDVSKIFKIINTTKTDVFISRLTTSCMCTKAYFVKLDGTKKGPFSMVGMGFVPKLNETLKPGETRDIEVVYDPNAHGPAGVGVINRFVYLEDLSGKQLSFEIKANVTP